MSKNSGLRWSQEQLDAHRARADALVSPRAAATPAPDADLPPDVKRLVRADQAKKRFQAKGRLPKGTMNKTETAYAEEVLEPMRLAGQILWWKFHVIKVRLADGAWYEADFLVMHADMSLAIHETKGEFVTDKGQLKIRLAAEAFPVCRMIKATKLSKKNGGGWKTEEF